MRSTCLRDQDVFRCRCWVVLRRRLHHLAITFEILLLDFDIFQVINLVSLLEMNVVCPKSIDKLYIAVDPCLFCVGALILFAFGRGRPSLSLVLYFARVRNMRALLQFLSHSRVMMMARDPFIVHYFDK